MSTPVADNVELFQGGSGSETYPQNIIVKSSTWSVFKSGGKLLIKEYGESYASYLRLSVTSYSLSNARKTDGSFYDDRFWVWYVDTLKNLTLLEIEPFSSLSPTIHLTKAITSNVSSVNAYLQENDVIRVTVLYDTAPKELKVLKYSDR